MENSELVRLDETENPVWLQNMDWDEYEKLASIGYSPENLALYYKIKKIEFMYYYMLQDSELEMHYQRGVLFYQAKSGMKMVEQSDSNITQAQRLDKMKDTISFQNARDEIIYGGF